MKLLQGRKSRKQIANELEGWASGAYGMAKRPDILSATEVVADYWQEIVAALRGEKENGKRVRRDTMSEAERTGPAGNPFGGIACLTEGCRCNE